MRIEIEIELEIMGENRNVLLILQADITKSQKLSAENQK